MRFKPRSCCWGGRKKIGKSMDQGGRSNSSSFPRSSQASRSTCSATLAHFQQSRGCIPCPTSSRLVVQYLLRFRYLAVGPRIVGLPVPITMNAAARRLPLVARRQLSCQPARQFVRTLPRTAPHASLRVVQRYASTSAPDPSSASPAAGTNVDVQSPANKLPQEEDEVLKTGAEQDPELYVRSQCQGIALVSNLRGLTGRPRS